MRVDNCSACGSDHVNVITTKLKSPRAPWTHFFTCPESGDPVMVGTFTRGDIGAQVSVTLMDDLTAKIVRAESTASFMVAIWRVESGKLHYDRVTSAFPSNEFGECCKMLERDLVKEAGPPDEVELRTVPAPQIGDADV